MFFPELCMIVNPLRLPLVYCSFRVVTSGSSRIHWKGSVIYLLYRFNIQLGLRLPYSRMSGVGRLGVLIPANKCSTCSVAKLGKQISCAIYCKSFSEKNAEFVFSRSGPWGHLRPVRKCVCRNCVFYHNGRFFEIEYMKRRRGFWLLAFWCALWFEPLANFSHARAHSRAFCSTTGTKKKRETARSLVICQLVQISRITVWNGP